MVNVDTKNRKNEKFNLNIHVLKSKKQKTSVINDKYNYWD